MLIDESGETIAEGLGACLQCWLGHARSDADQRGPWAFELAILVDEHEVTQLSTLKTKGFLIDLLNLVERFGGKVEL